MARGKDVVGATAEPAALSSQQEAVLLHLLSGKNQQEAAAAADCAPETVSRWMNGDALFVAELNRRRREVWEGHAERLRSLAGDALDTIGDVLHGGGDERVRLSAALAVLKSLGLGELQKPGGPTHPEEVRKQWRNEEIFRALL